MAHVIKVGLIVGSLLNVLFTWVLVSDGEFSSWSDGLVLWPAFVIGVMLLHGMGVLNAKAKAAGERMGERVANALTKSAD